jgi:signal transduction histidine kinase/FixJ family two-component response regulator
MALRHTFYHRFFLTVIFCAFAATFGYAQTQSNDVTQTTSEELQVIPTAQNIARLIEEKGLVKSGIASETLPPKTVSEAISQIVFVLPLGDKDKFDNALNTLNELALKGENPYDRGIVALFTRYSELFNFNNVTENYEDITRYLQEIPKSEHWLVRFHAKRLLSVTHTHKQNNALALQVAEDALALIPNEISEEATHTRISATSLIAYLQNLQFNKELALENTQKLIDLKLEAGKEIDGIELLNNLMYSHNAWRDNEVRLDLVQTLIRMEEKYGATTPGLSYLHASGVFIDVERYEDAKTSALAAISRVRHETLRMAAKLNLATAHAGLGQTIQARDLLNTLPGAAKESAKGQYTLALIALREGRADEALTLMNTRYDNRVRRFLEDKSNNTTEMLASLENSSVRQAEREAALQREASLTKSRLEQQKNINRLLIGLFCLAFLTGTGAVIFARNRHRLSKLLEIKTAEAESADRMKTEFLGMVSHELRTPLNGIIGLADIISAQSEDEKTRQRAGIILNSGNLLFNLIESIIDMSRLDGGKMELVAQECSIAEIAGKLAKKRQKQSAEKGLIFTYHIPAAASQPIEIDPVRIEQCIDTLLSNAIRFTETGRVHLHLETKADEASGHLNFSVIVADTGQGMNEDVQRKLFKPFLQADTSMTRKHGGSGLRLAIARAMIRMMDGDITVLSREGKGSEFTLIFPAKPVLNTVILNKQARNKHNEKEHGKRPHIPAKAERFLASPKRERRENHKVVQTAQLEENTESVTTKPQPDLPDEDDVFATLCLEETKADPDNLPLDMDDLETALFEAEIIESSLPSAKVVSQTHQRNTTPTVEELESIKESLHTSRVLIVDDDASNRDVVEILLKPVGIDCFSVTSGTEALDVMSTHYFDVIIMDIRMPEMDGVEAIQRIRQSGAAWANVPIIALTADIAAENNAACMAAGANVFLTKPVLAKDLLDAICFLKFQDERVLQEHKLGSIASDDLNSLTG